MGRLVVLPQGEGLPSLFPQSRGEEGGGGFGKGFLLSGAFPHKEQVWSRDGEGSPERDLEVLRRLGFADPSPSRKEKPLSRPPVRVEVVPFAGAYGYGHDFGRTGSRPQEGFPACRPHKSPCNILFIFCGGEGASSVQEHAAGGDEGLGGPKEVPLEPL